MPRARIPSVIDTLTPAARRKLKNWFADPAISNTEATRRLNAFLASLGVSQRVSRHSVGRYYKRFEAAGQKVRESREILRMWLDKAGTEDLSAHGKVAVEFLHQLVFDVLTHIQSAGDTDETNVDERVKQIRQLALSIRSLEAAGKSNADRDLQLQKRAAMELVEEARRRASEAADPAALAAALEDRVRRIYGVQVPS